MDNNIDIWGIETNNLKNIDITLKKHAINLIIGPSGSGKSSLAYDTIAQIGQREFLTMFADNGSDPTYKVKGYKNIVAAVPLKQTNFNNNIRSTVGTYFGINRYIGFIYSALLGISEDNFVLNKQNNLCDMCHGVGVVEELDVNKLINYNLPLKDNPVKCWDRHKEFYRKIIVEFCADYGIDSNKTFSNLSEKEQHLFLYGESSKKYKITYKKVNALSSRTTKYFGVMLKKPMLLGVNISDKYNSDVICPYCNGKKYSHEIDQMKVNGLSIGEYMLTSFNEIKGFNQELRIKTSNHSIDFALDFIDSFINKAIDFNLGHLNFHRAIPTLSGGELQRLRMVQVFNTQLTDLMIVLDEPLGGLSGNERIKVYENIVNLSKKHTVVIVDHSDIFVQCSSNIIALGEKSGKNGGFLIDPKRYLDQQSHNYDFHVEPPGSPIRIFLNSPIYNYHGVDVTISKNSLNLVTGASGVGKSTLIREYFPQYFESYSYINQRPIMGNRNSNVATSLDIATDIFITYAEKFKKDKEYFSNHTGSEGCCSTCLGAGFIEYGNERSSVIRLECGECSGTGFNSILRKHKINGKSIFDVWNLTIDEAIDFFNDVNPKISKKLNPATDILLGHLIIGQPTSTLSGGENIRIKLLKSRLSRSTVLGVDEPFRGLSNTEIYSVMLYLEVLRKSGKTIVVIDHNEQAYKYFQRHIHLCLKDNILIGEDVSFDTSQNSMS